METPFSAYQGDEPYIFVCYAHDDAALVYPEITRLHEAGFHVWYDEGVAPGELWSQEIADALNSANLFLVFISPRSAQSRHCLNEVQYAVAHDLRILTILLEATDMSGALELSLGATQAIHKFELSESLYREKVKLFLDGLPDHNVSRQRHRSVDTPNNLPIPLTQFVERTTLVSSVRESLLARSARCTTLLGPGGSGKSRLAVRCASDMLSTIKDGVYFVPLVAITNPDLIVPEIARTLGIAPLADTPVIETITEYLKDKDTLLVLDNFEQVRSGAIYLADILRACPDIKLLVTSREPLAISGEQRIAVPPMQLPAANDALSLSSAERFEAIQLFVNGAKLAQWDFQLSEVNLDHVVEICRSIDALPLAIELAAARLYDMTIIELHDALKQQTTALTDGPVDLHPHQRSLASLVAWSYELLDEDLRRLWRTLSLFPGSFTNDAVNQICARSSENEIRQLVQKSMLVRSSEPPVSIPASDEVSTLSKPRFYLLETLKHFAVEELNRDKEAKALRTRFVHWYVTFAEEIAPALKGPSSEEWRLVLDLESANLRQALEISLGRINPDPDYEAAMRISSAMFFYWYNGGHLKEGTEYLLEALKHGDKFQPELHAKGLFTVASLCRQQNRVDEADEWGNRALSLYRKLPDEKGIANCLVMLAGSSQRRDDYEEASHLVREAAEILTRLGDDDGLGVALNLQGINAQMSGNPSEAERCYAASLSIGQKLNSAKMIGTALINLGEIAEMQGAPELAEQRYCEALQIWWEIKQKLFIAYCFEVLAGIRNVRNRPKDAAILFGAADRIRDDLGTPVEPFNIERYERDLDVTKSSLTRELFQAAWREGQDMAVEEVVKTALAKQ